MLIEETSLPGVLHLTPRVFGDDRGYFVETYSQSKLAAAGMDATFVQDNESSSQPGVVRGLHYQHPNDQGKLVRVISGAILDVAVDIRPGSPTFGQWARLRAIRDEQAAALGAARLRPRLFGAWRRERRDRL